MSITRLKAIVRPMGDCALQVRLESEVATSSAEQYERLLAARHLAFYLEQTESKPTIFAAAEYVPAYSSVLVTFPAQPLDEIAILQKELTVQVNDFLEEYAANSSQFRLDVTRPAQTHRVAVNYGGEYGPDLEDVAAINHITSEEVIARHTAQTYEVYFLGFAPGYAYLGPLPANLDAPRLSRPRAKVRAGSVAMAAGLTAIYPLTSPGGWRLIGHTDLKIFDPAQDPPVLFLPGDKVIFYDASS